MIQRRELLTNVDGGKLLYLERREGSEFVPESPSLEEKLLEPLKLMEGGHHKKRLMSVFHSAMAWYLMGSASNSGFGLGLYERGNLWHELLNWDFSERENSSNWREVEFFTQIIKIGVEDGTLHNAEVLIVTENYVLEGCFYN